MDDVYDYYPNGLPTAENWERAGSPVIERKYQGQFAYWEKEMEWYGFMARMYYPALGKWVSVDPAGQFNSPYVGMGMIL